MREKEQPNLNHVIARWQATHHIEFCEFANMSLRAERRNRKTGEIRRLCDYDGTNVPRNDGNRGNSQGLLKVKNLFAYLPIRLFALKHASTQIIRGAAKARFRRTLRAGLADARTAPYRKFGFTLAEILVTLAVIGIVAAMTIPNLVQSYKKKVVETKLVKFYSMMNNAVKMAEADYGPQSTWTDYYEDVEYDDKGNELYQKGNKYDAHINKYFAPYIKIMGSEVIGKSKVYYLSDGSAFGFSTHENREIYFYPNNPQKCLQNSNDSMGSCRFVFAFLPIITYDYDKRYKYNRGNGMQPNLLDWDGKEDSLNNNSTLGCKNGSGWYCTEVIRRNGWKIPDNYPYKF